MGKMADPFFAFCGQNDVYFLAWFYIILLILDKTHSGGKELLKKGATSVATSLIPGNLCAVDKTLEAFMKFVKSKL